MTQEELSKHAEKLYRALEAVLPYCVFDNFTGMYAQRQAIEVMKEHTGEVVG